jgi:DNA repair ATPase RecN
MMGERDLERKLDRLSVEDEVVGKEMSIAQKKAVIAEMKKKYGRDWRKMIHVSGDLKHEMTALGQEYRSLNTPRPSRRA